MRWPCFSARAIATRPALEPTSVPFPPKSAPMASAYHKGLCVKPEIAFAKLGSNEMFWIIGIIVAVHGILSTKAEAMADIQTIKNIVAARSPPVIFNASCAIISKAPDASTPETITNNPAKKSNVGHYTHFDFQKSMYYKQHYYCKKNYHCFLEQHPVFDLFIFINLL